jgi:hypothetical protein
VCRFDDEEAKIGSPGGMLQYNIESSLNPTVNHKGANPMEEHFPASEGQKQRPADPMYPVAPQNHPGAEAQPTTIKRFPVRGRWLLCGTALGLVLVGSVAIWAVTRSSEPAFNPDLPEWFHPQYRIKKGRGNIFLPKAAKGQGTKTPQPASASPPAKYTQEWLDERFTHYVDWRNGFVWSKPRVVPPSEGKIYAGVKVIVGEQVNGMSLICTLTPDGRPENMYVENWVLRERSKGPPPMKKDE